MSRPRLLDLFCGAGLAADGYARAGFDVTGVDVAPQPEYAYRFTRRDALEVLRYEDLAHFDVIHASPPCQAHTRAGRLRDAQGGRARYDDLLTPTLELLADVEVPWVVENVPGAPGMENAVTLCGSSFGLAVRRHRLFLSNRALLSMPCFHGHQGRPWGVFHVPNDDIPGGGRTCRDAAHAQECMGVDRDVSWQGLKEGVPPVYTQFIGEQLLEHLKVEAAR